MRTVVLLLALVAAPLHAIADTPTGGGGGLRRDCATNQILKWSGTTWLCNTLSSGTVTSISTVAPLQGGPISTTGSISLTSCASNQIYKWNGSAWACAADANGVSGLTTGTVPKAASATTLADSPITINGSGGVLVAAPSGGNALVVAGHIETTSGGSINSATYIDAKGGQVYAYDGKSFISNGSLGFGYGDNATFTGLINDKGYLEGTTQFRNLTIRDGKSADIVAIVGSTKATTFSGAVTIAGDATANGDAYFGDANTDKLLSRSNVYSVTTSSAANKPAASSCGTSPAVVGGSLGFIVTPGTGSPTACTVTFATAFADTPACVITRIGGTSQQWFQWSSLSASAGTFQGCNSTACGGNTLTNSYAVQCVGTSINPGSP